MWYLIIGLVLFALTLLALIFSYKLDKKTKTDFVDVLTVVFISVVVSVCWPLTLVFLGLVGIYILISPLLDKTAEYFQRRKGEK